MEKKDLAEEYSIKDYERLNDSEPISEENLCFSIIDIKAAFNAGRESVIENAPEMSMAEKSLQRWTIPCPNSF